MVTPVTMRSFTRNLTTDECCKNDEDFHPWLIRIRLLIIYLTVDNEPQTSAEEQQQESTTNNDWPW